VTGDDRRELKKEMASFEGTIVGKTVNAQELPIRLTKLGSSLVAALGEPTQLPSVFVRVNLERTRRELRPIVAVVVGKLRCGCLMVET